MKSKKPQNGFALIELLVVLSIIGVLSGMVLVSVSEAKEKARDVKRVQQIQEIDKAILLYKSDNNGDAPLLSGLGPDGRNCSHSTELGANESGYCVAVAGEINGSYGDTSWIAFKAAIAQYMGGQVPEDPCPTCGDGLGYIYIAPAAIPGATSDSDYQIYANLERTDNRAGVSTTDDDFVEPDPVEESGNDYTAPTIPQNLVVTISGAAGEEIIEVNWSPSTDSGGSGLNRYQLFINGAIDGHYIVGTMKTFATNPYWLGQHICFTVVAIDNAENMSGQSSPEKCVDTQNFNVYEMSTPSNLMANVASYPSISFSWQHPIDPALSSSMVYEVYKVGDPTPVIANQSTYLGMYQTWALNDSSSFWTSNFCYTVRARATDPNNGSTIYSDMSGQYCAEPPPPVPVYSVSVPSNLQSVLNSTGRVQFSWFPSVSTYPGSNLIADYEIYRCLSGVCDFLAFTDSNGTPSPFLLISNIWGSNPICWSMRARDTGGHWSNMSSISCQP